MDIGMITFPSSIHLAASLPVVTWPKCHVKIKPLQYFTLQHRVIDEMYQTSPFLIMPLFLCRKNIVPHEYRRHFPIQMKDHNSHDVLLLCTSCHAVSNYYDNNLKQLLAEEFCAPIGCEEGVRMLEDATRRQVRSAARALLNASRLPEHRKVELLDEIKGFYCVEEVTEETLKEAANLETR